MFHFKHEDKFDNTDIIVNLSMITLKYGLIFFDLVFGLVSS